MPNVYDHRTTGSENWSDVAQAYAVAMLLGSLDQTAPTLNLTAAAGTGSGTAPPTPVVRPGSNAYRGFVTFGSGTTPSAATAAAPLTVCVITFPFAVPLSNIGLLPFVLLTPNSAAAGYLLGYTTTIVSNALTVLTITNSATLAASQGNTVYGVGWQISG